jgi:hypothetical protein
MCFHRPNPHSHALYTRSGSHSYALHSLGFASPCFFIVRVRILMLYTRLGSHSHALYTRSGPHSHSVSLLGSAFSCSLHSLWFAFSCVFSFARVRILMLPTLVRVRILMRFHCSRSHSHALISRLHCSPSAGPLFSQDSFQPDRFMQLTCSHTSSRGSAPFLLTRHALIHSSLAFGACPDLSLRTVRAAFVVFAQPSLALHVVVAITCYCWKHA